MAPRSPTPEQMQALQQFAAENGRNWKERLHDAWLKADARIGGEPSPFLQQVRNQFGPGWLESFVFTDAPTPRYIVCSYCERTHAVNGDGKVRRHRNGNAQCNGSGRSSEGFPVAPTYV